MKGGTGESIVLNGISDEPSIRPQVAGPKHKAIMKTQAPRPWTILLACGLAVGLTGCRSDELPQVALLAVPAAGGTTLLAQAPSDSTAAESAPVQQEPVEKESVDAAPPPPEEGPVPVPKPVTAPPELPPGVDEVVQLAQTQMGDEVLLAYIENSPARFDLDLHQILYLHDLGLSAQVIAAMVRHNQTLSVADADVPVTAPGVSPATAAPDLVGVAPADPVNGEREAVTQEPPPPTTAAVSTETAPQPVEHVTHNHFYTALAPYGTWIEMPDHGWVWRPTVSVIDPHWRPYVHGGRWVYTDYGWYWHSYYSWGWAPFHYGRWYLSPARGWVWVPGTVWGPAWVSWRYYDGYYGWAPLPPAAVYTSGIGLMYHGRHVSFGFSFGLGPTWYSFVPVRHFYTARPWYHCVPRTGVTQIYHNSTVINNYIVGDNNTTIINVGPGTDHITTVTRTEIQKVEVRDAPVGETRTIRAESLSRDGTSLAVYRPQLPEQAPAPPPEITRRQAELQRQTERVASSEAAQIATIRARNPDVPLSRQVVADGTERGRPSAAPRVVRTEPESSVGRPAPAPVSRGTPGPAASRAEPGSRQALSGGDVPVTTIRPGTTVSRSATTTPTVRPITPVRPEGATTPAQPRAVEPRRTVTPQAGATPQAPARVEPGRPALQPARPVQPVPQSSTSGTRFEPTRPGNPSYTVTPVAPSVSPARPVLTPQSPGVAPQQPRFEPPARPSVSQPSRAPLAPSRSFTPPSTISPAPRPVAPARSTFSPSPAVQAPAIQPRAVAPPPRFSSPSPSPAPARPPAAPAQPARGAGSR
jgi:hypothetical protein